MKKFILVCAFTIGCVFASFSQVAYEIKMNLKACKDTTVYLARYYLASH